MRTSASSLLTLSLPLLSLLPNIDAASFDCGSMLVEKKKFNFKKLSGPHSVTIQDDSKPPSIANTTWTIDLCQNLQKQKNVANSDQCPSYTRVCGIKRLWNPVDDPDAEHMLVEEVIPVAGNLDANHMALDPHYDRLKSEKVNSDEEGIQLELNGGYFGPKGATRKQKAIIHLICDKTRTGDEGNDVKTKRNLRLNEDDDDDDEEDDDGDSDGNEDGKKGVKQNPNSSLKFISYGPLEDNDEMDLLRLDWRTKYACEDAIDNGDDDNNDTDKSSSWGFFTWFILILFLGIAAYLIFGSWLNYNRYGARGWDLLPHGDTIRDLPYLFKDWSRSVVDTVTGGHSRGGYSAV